MKKTIRFLFILICLFLILMSAVILALSFYTGKKIEQDLPQWQANVIESCQQQAHLNHFEAKWCDLRLVTQQRHWFYTDLTFALQNQTQTMRIDHGPFPLNAIENGFWLPQMAAITLESSTKSNKPFPVNELPIKGLMTLSYGQNLQFNLTILPFEQAFAVDSKQPNWLLQNQQTQVSGEIDLKSAQLFKLNLNSDHLMINHNPLDQISFSIAYQKMENNQASQPKTPLEDLSFAFTLTQKAQTTQAGEITLNANLSSFALDQLIDLIQHRPNQWIKQVLPLVDSASLNFKGSDQTLAYLWLILQDKSSISQQAILNRTAQLNQYYQQLDFKQKLFLEQDDTSYQMNLSLDSMQKTIDINGASLPFQQF